MEKGQAKDKKLSQQPIVSVVVPTYNMWASIDRCLGSLRCQANPPQFEVLIVDDGSTSPPPKKLLAQAGINVRILRRPHLGVSAARNAGALCAAGHVILFVDGDCFLHEETLLNLADATKRYADDSTFQLTIAGDCSNVVGTAEHVYQSEVQDALCLPDGRIKWLNTAGFAIRQQFVKQHDPLFDTRAKRSQDTLLLARLSKKGILPRFLPTCIVYHSPHMSPLRFTVKGLTCSRQAHSANALIRTMNVDISASSKQRQQILIGLWKRALLMPQGKTIVAILMARHLLKLIGVALNRLHCKDGSVI